MRIAINTLSITPSRGGGLTFLGNMIESMAQAGTDHELVLVVGPLNRGLWEDVDGAELREVPLYSDSIAMRFVVEQLILPRRLGDWGVDVLWSPGNLACLRAPCPQVLTLQGPLALRNLRERYAPEGISWLKARAFDRLVPRSVERVDHIVCVSEDLRSWLTSWLEPDPEKVSVVLEGVDAERFVSAAEPPEQEEDGPYILSIGTLFPYKNVDKLVRAFAGALREENIGHNLVIAGRDPGGQLDRLAELSRSLGIAERVRFLGRVEGHRIPTLYKDADAFVFPSTVESFGLPPLEAMAAGTPVIASDRCSVPEVVGRAGIIIDPDDIPGFTEAIVDVLTDEDLRSELVNRGRDRVQELTWERAAQQMLEVLDRVGGGADR